MNAPEPSGHLTAADAVPHTATDAPAGPAPQQPIPQQPVPQQPIPQQLTQQERDRRRFRAVASLGSWMLRISVTTTVVSVVVTLLSVVGAILWGMWAMHTVQNADHSAGSFPVVMFIVPMIGSLVSMALSSLFFVACVAFVILSIISAVRARGSGRAGALLAVVPMVLNIIAAVVVYAVLIVGANVVPDAKEFSASWLLTGVGLLLLTVYVIAPVVSTLLAIIGSAMVRRWGRRNLATVADQA